jgi:hypothetical protein
MSVKRPEKQNLGRRATQVCQEFSGRSSDAGVAPVTRKGLDRITAQAFFVPSERLRESAAPAAALRNGFQVGGRSFKGLLVRILAHEQVVIPPHDH